eukprot:TCONS_00021396-protein
MPKSKNATNKIRNIKNPCGICSNPVATTHRAVWCDHCNYWVHIKCNNTSKSEYERLQHDDGTWLCQRCFNLEVPFGRISHEDLKLTLQGKNFDLVLDPSDDFNLQFFRDIDSALNQEDHVENNLLNFECPYLSLSEVNQKHKNNNSISALHLNIASLSLHHGELVTILNSCDIPFNFIGITETGFKDVNSAKSSAVITNYNHFDCCTKSNRGGARIYVSEGFDSIPRPDLDIYK